jgi:hypothetical protein
MYTLRGTSLRQISEWLVDPLLVSQAGALTGGMYQLLPIPSDQWRREVRRWFEIGLVTIQNDFLGYATGPTDERAVVLRTLDVDGEEVEKGARELCGMQIVRNVRGAVNFDFAALMGVIVAGVVVIVVGVNVGKVAKWWNGRLGAGGAEAQRRWEGDDMFVLQRRMHELVGVWDGEGGDMAERLRTSDVETEEYIEKR